VIVEMAIQYNDGYVENVFSFVNNINTIEGGTQPTASARRSPARSTTTRRKRG